MEIQIYEQHPPQLFCWPAFLIQTAGHDGLHQGCPVHFHNQLLERNLLDCQYWLCFLLVAPKFHLLTPSTMAQEGAPVAIALIDILSRNLPFQSWLWKHFTVARFTTWHTLFRNLSSLPILAVSGCPKLCLSLSSSFLFSSYSVPWLPYIDAQWKWIKARTERWKEEGSPSCTFPLLDAEIRRVCLVECLRVSQSP